MSLSIGIVGLPNVGKSTLFNALTNAGALAANYPFATIEPNVGVVPIPDPRLGALAELSASARIVPATVRFVDIAGLVKGASLGEGLGNRFLGNIRDVSAICHVVRVFGGDLVSHVDESPSPEGDIATVMAELCLADLETLERRHQRVAKESTVDRSLAAEASLLEDLMAAVGAGDPISAVPPLVARAADYEDLNLLTAKPVIYVFNCDEGALADHGLRDQLARLVAPAEALFLDAETETQLGELDEGERAEYLAALGQEVPGLDVVIQAAYRALGLQSFLTTGEKETRAWTITSGATAPQAAGVIHTDFQRGFIAAEVVDYEELLAAGSWHAARAKGKLRTEGRAYVMRPDDVVEFRFNV